MMELDELKELYNKVLNADKPAALNSKKKIPEAVLFYLVHQGEDVLSFQIADWITENVKGRVKVSGEMLAMHISCHRADFPFIERSEERVSRCFRASINIPPRWKQGYTYSLDKDVLEAATC